MSFSQIFTRTEMSGMKRMVVTRLKIVLELAMRRPVEAPLEHWRTKWKKIGSPPTLNQNVAMTSRTPRVAVRKWTSAACLATRFDAKAATMAVLVVPMLAPRAMMEAV